MTVRGENSSWIAECRLVGKFKQEDLARMLRALPRESIGQLLEDSLQAAFQVDAADNAAAH